jgi:membrane fusion protein (multidrug efflux system)
MEKEQQPPPVVESVRVEPERVENVARFVGQLNAAESIVIQPEISGVVAEISFSEGQVVEAGDPIVRLRDAEQRALVAEARAELALAQDVYDRSKRLRRSDARSEAELVRARAERDIARARLELVEVQLARTVIRAPFDGVIGARLVSTGERVSPGGTDRFSGNSATGIARIESLDRMELVFTVPETVATSLGELELSVEVASYPGRAFPGKLFFVAPRVDERNRRMLVKAAVPNAEHLLKPGMFASVAMKVAEYPEALMIPEDAVRYSGDGPSVWRLDAERVAHIAPVDLGLRKEGRVQVLRGLAPGDEVVISGIHKVVEGEAVETLRALPNGAKPAALVGDAAAAPAAQPTTKPAAAAPGAGT